MHDDAIRAAWIREVPQRRYAAPEDIAGAAVFLLDDSKAGFVTGHILNVEGGLRRGRISAGPELAVSISSDTERQDLALSIWNICI
jgi:enoyl-[acyl-carrier-protein] reductase (NADH)